MCAGPSTSTRCRCRERSLASPRVSASTPRNPPGGAIVEDLVAAKEAGAPIDDVVWNAGCSFPAANAPLAMVAAVGAAIGPEHERFNPAASFTYPGISLPAAMIASHERHRPDRRLQRPNRPVHSPGSESTLSAA
jgi:hypothetical protein